MEQPSEIPEGIYNVRFVDSSSNTVVLMEIGAEFTFIALVDIGKEITDLWEVDGCEFTYCHIAKGVLQQVDDTVKTELYSESRKRLAQVLKSSKDVRYTPGKLLDTNMKLRDIVKASKK